MASPAAIFRSLHHVEPLWAGLTLARSAWRSERTLYSTSKAANPWW